MSITTRLLVAALAFLMPALAGGQSVLLRGATVHSMVGEPVVADVLIDGHKIASVGVGLRAPDGSQVVDLQGLHLYPGFFDALSTIGLVEVNSVPATVDSVEVGDYNPQLVAVQAIHPASEVIPVTRSNGITHTLVAPASDGSGVLAGQASVVNLDGWTVEEMAVEARSAMVLTWPAIQTRSFDFATFSVRTAPFNDAKEKAEKKVAELREWLQAARHYRQATEFGRVVRATTDRKLAALAEVLDGRQAVLVRADSERDLRAAIDFAEKEGLRIVLSGARSAWKLKDVLADKHIPVILGLVLATPEHDDDAFDRPFTQAAELVAAGVKIAFGSAADVGGRGGPGGPHSARTLAYEVAVAVANGLPREEALRALTLSPAEIFGVEDRLGSVQVGRLANLIVTDGDPFEIRTEVKQVWIAGRAVGTDNKQQRLYETYANRPLPSP